MTGADTATAPETPWQELSRLARTGALVTEYPRLMGLVARLNEAEMLRAGRLLGDLDPDEVRRAHPSAAVLTVALTGHGTVSQLLPALTAEFARHGLLPRPVVGSFDSYVFDLGDPGSELYAAAPELTLCVLDPMVIFGKLPVPWEPADVQRVFADRLAVLGGLADQFEAASGGTLVMNTLPLPARFAAQLVDHRSRAQLGRVWREGNAALLRLAEDRADLIVLDLDPLIAEGVAAEDPRLSIYAKAHLSPALLACYAREIGHLARHLAGATKKVLALDLDGTTWGGVLGEDGLNGIEVADSFRGEAFQAFQRVAKQLGAQGVLLAAVSKNDLEPVREVFRDHPRMTLREEDLVRVVANWKPKHGNLVDLAKALNVGVDSIVFVDDSVFECGLVRSELPEVAVVQVDGEPALHVGKLLRDGWFTTRTLTAQDRSRGAEYRREQERQGFLDGFDSLADYLSELRIQVRLGPVAEAEVNRLSQLTLRTNQFNLTTRRLQPADVRDLLSDPANGVLAIHVSDRFGDSGLVGAVFTRREDDAVRIENFVLSCRVFARGIERACLAAVLRQARAAGASAVLADYRPTNKNGKVSDFYPQNGFTVVAATDAVATFRHDLSEIFPQPAHIELAENLGGPTRQ